MTLDDWLQDQRINGGPHGFECIGRERMQHVWNAARTLEKCQCAKWLVATAPYLYDAFVDEFMTPTPSQPAQAGLSPASELSDVLGAVPPEPTFTEKDITETNWKKEPAIEGKYGGCLNCGPRPSFFPPDGVIGVGFGYAGLHRDGEPVWTEPNEAESEDDYMTGAKAEELAAADPDHDWRIVMDGPLSGRTYQRHAAGEWALIEQNQGFA